MLAKDYVRFDEIDDVLASLDLLVLVARLVRETPSYWKWAIVAAHDALQGAMVCALNDTSGVSVLEQQSARKMLDWIDMQEGEAPKARLAGFKTLLQRCQDSSRMQGEPLTLNKAQLKDVNKLHEEFRNSFSHFIPQGWSIEKAGLPRIIGTAVDCIAELMERTQSLYKLTGNRKRRLSKNIKETRAVLARL